MTRLLVTGSRNWDDQQAVEAALGHAYRDLGEGEITLVHGDARGLDRIAGAIWHEFGYGPVEKHPITFEEWAKYGKRAAFIRNSAMVGMGADLCLAFNKGASPGTTMTANLAERSGIKTRRFTA